MPDLTRSVDFLHLHTNVRGRVRNLETGVHPTRSEFGYADNYPPTLVTITSSYYRTDIGTPAPLKWQRRSGIVSMFGRARIAAGHTHADLPATEPIATLPGPARPSVSLTLRGVMNTAPWFFLYELATDGTITVQKPDASTSSYSLYFEGASWTAD